MHHVIFVPPDSSYSSVAAPCTDNCSPDLSLQIQLQRVWQSEFSTVSRQV